jgi:serine/threonine-protein kinase
VLVVDDDAGMRAALTEWLSDSYEVIGVGSGHEAAEHITDGTSAVVLDVKMRGLDGFQTFALLRTKTTLEVPIIFYSAYQDLKDPYDVLNEYRPFGYVLKDGNPRALLDTVASAVRHHQQVLANRELLEDLRELNETLEARVRDRTRELEGALAHIQQLNAILDESLKRQIAARTADLTDRLARAASRPEATSRLERDAIVGQRYRVLAQIGKGGMGDVYKVERVSDHRPFALKVLTQTRGHAEVARMAREANIISRLAHPNVVSVVDFELDPEGVCYIVMDLVEGKPLTALRSRYGDVPWVLDVLAQLAEALRVIHDQGFIHRDLKPGNVMIEQPDAKPRVKLVDFGIALAARAAPGAPGTSPDESFICASSEATNDADPTLQLNALSQPFPSDVARRPPPAVSRLRSAAAHSGPPPLTEAGQLVGTLKYMAPELQAGSRNVGPWSDVFSFGVMAYELLLNMRTFDIHPIALRIAGWPLPKPPSLEPVANHLSHTLIHCLERCLSEEPTERPTAEALVSALTRAPDSAHARS